MSSEQQDGQSVPDPSSSKAPENRNPVIPEAHRETVETGTNRETDAGDGTTSVAILPIRGLVLFPGMVVPLTIGRPSALKLVDSELPESKQLGLVTQRDEQLDRPEPTDLFSVGVATQILKLIRQPYGTAVLIVQALRRIVIESFTQTEPYLRASVRTLKTVLPKGDTTELEASFNNLRSAALKLLELSPEIPDQARAALINVEQPEQLTDLMAGNLGIDLPAKQAILEEVDLLAPMVMVKEPLKRQLKFAKQKQKLKKDAEGRFSATQRKAYPRERLGAI